MLILVEGPEKQGKSTLALEISRQLGFEYCHSGPPVGGALGYAYQLQQLVKRGGDVIMDRSFIGELVYGPLLRGKSCVNPLQFDVLCRLANSLGALVVYAQQDSYTAARWFKQEQKISQFQQDLATQRFGQVMRGVVQSRLPVIPYQANSLIKLRKWLADQDHLIGNRSYWFHKYRAHAKGFTGYGANHPETIFVGEQLSPRNQWLGLPFDGGPASEYLHETLELAGINQRDCYFLNAKLRGGAFASTLELDYLRQTGNPRFVALGTIANEFLAYHGLTRMALPHPQYFKRFRSKEQHLYVNLLQEACR